MERKYGLLNTKTASRDTRRVLFDSTYLSHVTIYATPNMLCKAVASGYTKRSPDEVTPWRAACRARDPPFEFRKNAPVHQRDVWATGGDFQWPYFELLFSILNCIGGPHRVDLETNIYLPSNGPVLGPIDLVGGARLMGPGRGA